MNIYQNEAFSGILHKLTKYQALAASAKDRSKQSLYSQKIQEYRNKLNEMNYVQTGGVLSPTNQTKKTEIITKIGNLLPESFKSAYDTLVTAHINLNAELQKIRTTVQTKINAYNEAKRRQEAKSETALRELQTKLQVAEGDSQDLVNAKNELTSRLQQIERLRQELEEARLANEKDKVKTMEAKVAEQQAALQAAAQAPDLSTQMRQAVREFAVDAQQKFEVQQLQAELALAQAELARLRDQGNVSQDCDKEIEQILRVIDNTVKTVNQQQGPQVPQDISGLSQTAQGILDQLQTSQL
jgi:DNA repair exonuclease SbcCD ATPase subunit